MAQSDVQELLSGFTEYRNNLMKKREQLSKEIQERAESLKAIDAALKGEDNHTKPVEKKATVNKEEPKKQEKRPAEKESDDTYDDDLPF